MNRELEERATEMREKNAVTVSHRLTKYAAKRPAGVEALIADAAARYQTTRGEILGPRQFTPLPAARAEIARELRRLGYSLSRIGRLLGRDHTTIVYYLKLGKINGEPDRVTPLAPGEPDLSGEWNV